MKNSKLILYALKSSSSGYTLVESLMALVVVGILITSVAPMLALTTASRVQARRVDQATQALRSYVDGVRGGVILPPQKFRVNKPKFKAPSYNSPPNASMITTPDPGTLIDTNGNGFSTDDPQDLVIQAIRPVAYCPDPDNPPDTKDCDIGSIEDKDEEIIKANAQEIIQANAQGFVMIVRVFRADAFANGAVPSGTEQASVFIGNLGSRNNPLVSSVSEIFPQANWDSIRGRDNLTLGGS